MDLERADGSVFLTREGVNRHDQKEQENERFDSCWAEQGNSSGAQKSETESRERRRKNDSPVQRNLTGILKRGDRSSTDGGKLVRSQNRWNKRCQVGRK